jgi:hypothetical protein
LSGWPFQWTTPDFCAIIGPPAHLEALMPHRTTAVLCLLVLSALAPGCENPELPFAPSALDTGIVLFEHANFHGNSAHVTSDIRDLREFIGPCLHDDGNGSVARDWNDCVSSVRVAPGWRATLYRDDDFDDDSLEITADAPNLQLVAGDCPHDGMNDCVSSVRVRRD